MRYNRNPRPRRLHLLRRALPAAHAVALCLCFVLAPSVSGQLVIAREYEVNQDIPDGGELLFAPNWLIGNAPIGELSVTLDIAGTTPGTAFNGDLFVSLGHDSGFSVLLNRVGKLTENGAGYSDAGFSIRLNDSAPNGDIHVYRQTLFGNHTTPLGGPLTGVWAPDGRTNDPAVVLASDPRVAGLGVFQGANIGGEWRLFLADLSIGGAQTLNRFGFEVRTAGEFAGAITFSGEQVRADSGPVTLTNAINLLTDVTFHGTHPLTFSGNVAVQSSHMLTVENETAIGGQIQESTPATLIKTGGGTLTLSGANTYSGGTIVRDGRLAVANLTGSATGSGQVLVQSNAVLSGSGTIAGPVVLEEGATVSPGESPGVLATGPMTWHAGMRYDWEINQASMSAGNNPGWDLLAINGALTLESGSGGTFYIDLTTLTLDGVSGPLADFDPTQSYTWAIAVTSDGIIQFVPEQFTLNTDNFVNPFDGFFSLQINGTALQLVYTPIPEPSVLSLVAALLLAAWPWSRRMRKL